MNQDDFNPDSEANEDEDCPVYIVDDATASMVAIACDCMLQLADAQLDDTARENLKTIVDSLAERFALNSIEIIEEQHGDEIIYSPKGGLFNDNEDEPEQS